jgi:hypothetical protein
MTMVASGEKVWKLNGLYHRTDGPAIEFADGDKWWYLNGDRHRIDGPAIEWANGRADWYLYGTYYHFNVWLDVNSDITDGEKIMIKLRYG